ncbi:hypothetical protein HK098_006580 [Nowakowskiella sp. JEL0407]|nr:hypothetical protein HK098_006580 [Nowakowskiella sp. JEL0407]
MTALGLWNIASALSFLNSSSVIHGNISKNSIFLSSSGEWKLFGLEFTCSSPSQLTSSPSSHFFPPELSSASRPDLDGLPIHCIDSWMFAMFLNSIFNPESSNFVKGAIPTTLYNQIRGLVIKDAKSRKSIKDVIIDAKAGWWWDNEPVRIALELNEMSIVGKDRGDEILRKLQPLLSTTTFADEYKTFKILPNLLSALEFGGFINALPVVLEIAKELQKSEFDKVVWPCLARLFGNQDRQVRRMLLDYMETIISLLTKFGDGKESKVVVDVVWNNISVGFSDPSPIIREATLKSILSIIPKLNDRIINTDLLKYLAKLQVDEEPGIRTNTTICLGKLAKHLNEPTRKKVLVPAFTRALKDPFPPSRNAGLLAISATVEFLDIVEITQRLIPHVSVLLIDTEKNIRTLAFKCIDGLIKTVEKHAKDMPETANLPPQSTTTGQSAATKATSPASTTDGWSSWTATKLTESIMGKPKPVVSPTDSGKTSSQGDTVKSSVDYGTRSSVEQQVSEKKVESGWDTLENGWEEETDDLFDDTATTKPLQTNNSVSLSKPGTGGGGMKLTSQKESLFLDDAFETSSRTSTSSSVTNLMETDTFFGDVKGGVVEEKSAIEIDRERRRAKLAEMKEARKAARLGAKKI